MAIDPKDPELKDTIKKLNKNLNKLSQNMSTLSKGVIPGLAFNKVLTGAIQDSTAVSKALVLSNKSSEKNLALFAKDLRSSYLTVSESAKIYSEATQAGIADMVDELKGMGENFTVLGQSLGKGFSIIRMNTQLLGQNTQASRDFTESLVSNAVAYKQSSDNLITAINDLRKTFGNIGFDFGKEFALEGQEVLSRLILTAGQDFTSEAQSAIKTLFGEGTKSFVARQALGVTEGQPMAKQMVDAIKGAMNLIGPGTDPVARAAQTEAFANLGLTKDFFILSQKLMEKTNGFLDPLQKNSIEQLTSQALQIDLAKSLKSVMEGLKAELIPMVAMAAEFVSKNLVWIKWIAKGVVGISIILSTTIIPLLTYIAGRKVFQILGWKDLMTALTALPVIMGKTVKTSMATAAQTSTAVSLLGSARGVGGVAAGAAAANATKTVLLTILKRATVIGAVATAGYGLYKLFTATSEKATEVAKETLDVQKRRLSMEEAKNTDKQGAQTLKKIQSQNAQLIMALNTLTEINKRGNDQRNKTVIQGEQATYQREQLLEQSNTLIFEDTGI